jgi:hypothetical protein
MAAPIRPNTGPACNLVLTERGRRALLLDAAGIDLPAAYHAWGAPDSPRCTYGHRLVRGNLLLGGECAVCKQRGFAS